MRHFYTVASALLVASLGCHNQRVNDRSNQQAGLDTSAQSENRSKVVELREQVLVTFRPAAPDYPSALRQSGIQGDIKLVLHLSKDGTIVRIEKESGPEEFLQYAETYARQMRFEVDPSCFPQMQTVPFHLTLQFRLPSKSSQ